MRMWAVSEHDREYEITGEAVSLIPLRNRRVGPDGVEQFTCITEAMTRFRCGDRVCPGTDVGRSATDGIGGGGATASGWRR